MRSKEAGSNQPVTPLHNILPGELASLYSERIERVLDYAEPEFRQPETGRPILTQHYRIDPSDGFVVGFTVALNGERVWQIGGQSTTTPGPDMVKGILGRLDELLAQDAPGARWATYTASHPATPTSEVAVSAYWSKSIVGRTVHCLTVSPADNPVLTYSQLRVDDGVPTFFSGYSPGALTHKQTLALLAEGQPPTTT